MILISKIKPLKSWKFFDGDTNTVYIWLPDTHGIQMVNMCPIAEWSINWMPFGYQTKSPVTEWSRDKINHSLNGLVKFQ